MDLSHVIIGPVVTEKAERLKAAAGKKAYTLWVCNDATKVEVKSALKKFYDVDAVQVRMMHTEPKTRSLGAGKVMEKRHAGKKAIVTLSQNSKVLDLIAFQSTSS
jgi:large subunit ribosomal protein L23